MKYQCNSKSRYFIPTILAIVLFHFAPQALNAKNQFRLEHPTFNQFSDLQWFPSSQSLLIDSRWIFNLTSQKILALPYLDEQQVSLSPSGFIAILDGDRFRTGSLNSRLGKWITIPTWLHYTRDKDPIFTENILFWVSDKLLFFYQNNVFIGSQCRLFNVPQHKWMKVTKDCIYGEFPQIYRLEAGSNNRVAVYANAEGITSLSIINYTPDKGQKNITIPQLNQCPGTSIVVTFKSTSGIYLTSPCNLTNEPEYSLPNCQKEQNWQLYKWSQSGLSLEKTCFPKYFTISPSGEYIAWSEKGKIYIKNLQGSYPLKVIPIAPENSQ